MTNMLSQSLLFCLAAVLSASAGERVKYPPPIQNVSRTIFWNKEKDKHQFTFRGGIINYWPSRGAQWTRNHNSQSGATFAAAPGSAAMPNGCLVYACARAEQIRLNQNDGETQSRVIAYRRSDGTGHAFVLFKRGKAYVAEDNCGNTAVMPVFENRAAAEALYMAQTFQKRTTAGLSAPVQASFIGKF